MKSKLKMTVVAGLVALSMGLTGCASTAGGPMTGSHATDLGILGAVAGGAIGKIGCGLVNGNKGTCNSMMVLGAGAGGALGYSQGKTMDQAEAQRRQMEAERMQSLMQQNAGLRSQIQYAQMPVQTSQGMQNQQVAQALEFPVARVEMVNSRTGALNKKALNTLKSMESVALRERALMEVYVPAADANYMGAIQGTVPSAKLYQQNNYSQYVIVVKPQSFLAQQQQPQQYGQPGGYR